MVITLLLLAAAGVVFILGLLTGSLLAASYEIKRQARRASPASVVAFPHRRA
jgi:hypothetical protein